MTEDCQDVCRLGAVVYDGIPIWIIRDTKVTRHNSLNIVTLPHSKLAIRLIRH